jgi:hypothetical protein
LRELRPPKKKTPNSGANIGAIAGELLRDNKYLFNNCSNTSSTCYTNI